SVFCACSLLIDPVSPWPRAKTLEKLPSSPPLGHPSRTTCPDPADGSGHADGLLVGLDDGDDAFGVSGVGLAGVLHRDLVDDVPGGVAVEPFGNPAADDDRLKRIVGGGLGERDPGVAGRVVGLAAARTRGEDVL